MMPPPLPPLHRRRLHAIWRSAGLVTRCFDAAGRETLRVTDAAISLLAAARRRQQAAFAAHEALVAQVARALQRAGRIVWRGLALRAPLDRPDGGTAWALAMPDVYSIRHTSVEDATEAAAHEIKVSRADLLADLRRRDKARAYLALSSQCWYVLRRGIAQAHEVPEPFGVMFADGGELEVVRPAPRRALRLPFATWMALARADAEDAADEPQALLGAPRG